MRKTFLPQISYIFILLSAAGWLLQCATNPVTGKREFMLMSESQEIQMGRETDPQIMASYGLYQDDALTQYIDDLGQRMAVISHRPQLTFTFRVLDSPVVNAFAVPGGYVYVTRGILSFMNNEAELAAVLGHEIGHITARHSAKQYSKAQLAGLGLGLGQMLSEDFRKYAGYAEFGVGLLFMRFSRDNERQADQLGVEYSSKVGYDATKMSDFFTSLERLAGGADQGGLPGWFSTHPNPVDRVAATRRMAGEWQAKLGTGDWKVNRDQYFDTIDGLVYGDDPRQGFVEANTFYHPSLRFQFPVPQGWTLNNLPTQVQIAPEAKDAIIMLTIEEGTNPRNAAQTFAEKTGAIVHSSKSVTVNGLQGHYLLSDIQSGQSNLTLLSYFIAQDNRIFVLHGLSTPDRFATHRNTFSHTMTNFSTLTDPSILNIEPDRIQIVRAKETAPFRTLLDAFTRDEDRKKDLALLNGVTSDETITAGTPLKITTSK